LASDTDGVEFGAFGSWKTGETHTFCSRADSELDQDQLKRKREAIAEAQKQRDAEIKQMQGQAAKRANEMLNACDTSITSHPYLDRKQIKKHSAMIGEFVRYGDDGAIWARHENALLIPMINDAGKIVNVQAIFDDGSKIFSRGGRKKGCYHVISGRNSNAPIFVCEGFATGATINESTDCTVVIAFDAGNLMPVAESVKKLYTGRKVVIAADNDQWGETNAGITKAEQASKNLGIPFISPVFADTTSKPTDFNDLAILQGHAEVARQLLTETPKIEVHRYLCD
jgi:putative DNA primase/helicase